MLINIYFNSLLVGLKENNNLFALNRPVQEAYAFCAGLFIFLRELEEFLKREGDSKAVNKLLDIDQ